MLILFCSIYTHHLADVTINGDNEQLEWISNGRKGTGEGVRMFKTYSPEYIQQLELNLHVEATRMWRIKVTTEILATLSVICILIISVYTFISKNRSKAVLTLQKNKGFNWLIFSLALLSLTYIIDYVFNTADLVSPEGRQASFYIIAVVFFSSPLLFAISYYYNRKELIAGLQTTKWRFRLSLFFLILSLSAVLFIGIALILFTPDLSGNIT